MVAVQLELGDIQNDELAASLLGHGVLKVDFGIRNTLGFSVSFEEFHYKILLLGCAFVASVGLGKEHLERALLGLAQHTALDLLEGGGFAIDFGENQFSCLVNVEANLVAFLFFVDEDGGLSAVFRFWGNLDVEYLIEGEGLDKARAAISTEVIDVLFKGLIVLQIQKEVVHSEV